ncbi:hypothetical protein TIFTF001_046825 [Ficus carica]|uniref:Uncharacterized protein n=1 Tax=Ficus carica TaxID=3494 RepID=A0AA87Z6I7_FICCA|nr:hypothetical protein TIFTF001_046825 [Ficus carica]
MSVLRIKICIATVNVDLDGLNDHEKRSWNLYKGKKLAIIFPVSPLPPIFTRESSKGIPSCDRQLSGIGRHKARRFPVKKNTKTQ